MTKDGLLDWTFGFADTKRRLGVYKYRTKRIEIAEYFALNSPDELVLDLVSQHKSQNRFLDRFIDGES
jgi:hypothetical protein